MKKLIMTVGIVLILANFYGTPIEVQANSEESLKASITDESWTNAAIFSKKLAVYYDEAKQYQKATEYYIESANYWTKAGHPSWGIQNLIRADHIGTEVELYIEQPIRAKQSLAKFEPTSGTYLGLFLAGKRENANPDPVEEIYGKNHAIYLTYTTWGEKYADTNTYFPMKFANEAKRNNSGIQIGFEPMNGLDEVVEGEYIRQFAREAKASGIPVFLRFMGEMNGEWVPWSGDPQKYIEKFRLVHDIMEQEAPNVAMVWSPNFLPRHNINPYYPGDDYVDWVGLSLYTIPFSHNKEVLGGNPIDYLKPIYDKYSHKPMMISEGAVSHYSYQLKKDFSDWAAGQIGNMYGFLPRMFPQIKAVTYFNLDKQTTNYDNKNNNYDLGDSKLVDEAYQRIIQSTYFLDHLAMDKENDSVQSKYIPITDVENLSGVRNAFMYVKLPLGVQPYYVAAYQGKRKLGESYIQPWDLKLNLKQIKQNEPITLVAFDENFKRLATETVVLRKEKE
ncbi:glycosyl hydrolase [Ureibacillus sp. GCM10028918]|uniref:glycosyl hydrolase n=1 Tax=Ureibacillus sp. GCM10028918 TaxID=3273429 RepID=UPI0036196069